MGIRGPGLAGTATLLLTACPGSGSAGVAAPPLPTVTQTQVRDTRTGAEVRWDAVAALREAGAVRAEGTFLRNGATAAMDVHLQDDGAVGAFTVGSEVVQVIAIADAAYVRAAAAFWTAFGTPEPLATRIAGRWLNLPAQDVAGIGPLSLSALVDELLTPMSGVVDEVGDGEVRGRPVRIVTTVDGDTMSVLAGPDGYPVDLRTGTPRGSTLLQFSDVGDRQELGAPADVVRLADLGR